jgi:small-conductance mechanosensitive channel
MTDATARLLHGHFLWAVRALAVAVFLNTVHRQVVAPPALTIATSAFMALAVALLLIHLLRRLRRPQDGGDAPAWSAPGLMTIGWIAAALILGALIAGYVGLAGFIAERLVVAVAVFGAAYLTIVLVDALFAEIVVADQPVGRAVAANLGLRPHTVELAGTLVSAVLRLAVVIAAVLAMGAILVAVGPRGLTAYEVFGRFHDTLLGAGIAGITISLGTVLGAAVLLLLGLLATRAVQRWLERQFLPRTSLDPGLQHSVSAIVGYVGVIAVAALALAEAGIDLQKIALIAGALSVGIGFGLQSIVSNFVSGLILLAERPIRVGDSIVVKGEEGWVRRIRVRATEIETFERASVIIPNSELITGVVKNWTHANTMGRIILKIGVDYASDPEQVRDLLLECAHEHPQVLDVPPPRALLLNFGDNALEFELRCVVKDFDWSLIVKSDLYFAILRRLRAAGIRIPAPQREVRVVGGSAAPLAKPADA